MDRLDDIEAFLAIVEGLAKAPLAFMGLLKGDNFGKLIVKIDA